MTALGLIAGNRELPLIIARNFKTLHPDALLHVICLKGEANRAITRYADTLEWVTCTHLGALMRSIKKSGITQWMMAGQVSPIRIFNRFRWDKELRAFTLSLTDFRPHTIFTALIKKLEESGASFCDSTRYLSDELAAVGPMNTLTLAEHTQRDYAFSVNIISKFVELDIGQTIVVKNGAVAALEAFEGTDATILRAARFAGSGCLVSKFARRQQDMRFDVPVIGMRTLSILRRIRASGLLLEAGKVILLNKTRVLGQARAWGIPIIGVATPIQNI